MTRAGLAAHGFVVAVTDEGAVDGPVERDGIHRITGIEAMAVPRPSGGLW